MTINNRVVWSEGLFLRPQHFQQQERYLERHVEIRSTALRAHGWGFTELEFERDLLVERTQAGLKRAKAQGKKLGRPNSLTVEQQDKVRLRRRKGDSLGVLAKEFGVSRSAIQRVERGFMDSSETD